MTFFCQLKIRKTFFKRFWCIKIIISTWGLWFVLRLSLHVFSTSSFHNNEKSKMEKRKDRDFRTCRWRWYCTNGISREEDIEREQRAFVDRGFNIRRFLIGLSGFQYMSQQLGLNFGNGLGPWASAHHDPCFEIKQETMNYMQTDLASWIDLNWLCVSRKLFCPGWYTEGPESVSGGLLGC